MGYESRLYVVDKHRAANYAQKIAVINMGVMGYNNGWKELFCNLLACDLYAEDGNTLITEDNYGEKLKSTDIQSVIEWLETKGREMDYRRIEPLIGFLKGFDPNEWEDLQVVHYGY